MVFSLQGCHGRGTIHPKKLLRFSALRDVLGQHIQLIEDNRQKSKVKYRLYDSYMSGFAMFYLQDPSLLEFQRRFEQQIGANNLRSVFATEKIPGDSQLRDTIDEHDPEPIYGTFNEYLRRLQRGKHLEKFRYLQEGYLVTMDGSEYFRSQAICCAHCLHSSSSKKGDEYYHQILQATVVHPDKRQVIPLAPEFIRNGDGESKQDCELTAAKRLIPRIRAEHRQLPMVLVADSLHSKVPIVRMLRKHHISFLLTAKPTDHKSLFEDIAGMRTGGMLDHYEWCDSKGVRYLYEWVNAVALTGAKDTEYTNFIEFRIIRDGKQTYHSSWITDIEVTSENVKRLVRAARARWKIENEGFNTLKNQGYHLEHNFGHGKSNLSGTFFLLNLLAFFVHQILELTDSLYQKCRASFSSRKEFWNVIRASFRFFIFSDWQQVLTRLIAPAQPP
jgi:hypothetical protein